MQLSQFQPRARLAGGTTALVLGLSATGAAHAGLGELAASVQHDHSALRASAEEVTALPRFVRHTLRTPQGGQVHEFVGADGRVFAVSWSGPTLPDLKTLLASHYDEYVGQAAKRHASHHVFTMSTDGLVLGITRLPRGFSGAAHVPALLPAGVSAQDIR